jgi:hypothetical protein
MLNRCHHITDTSLYVLLNAINGEAFPLLFIDTAWIREQVAGK